MFDWLTQRLAAWNLTWYDVLIGASLSAVTFIGSIAVVTFVLVRLPPNYFHSSHAREFLTDQHRAIRWAGIIVKNLVGLLLVFLGIIMSLPGVPGQGILTILLGIMLLDFPGKRGLELRLVSRPKVLQTINQIRRKFDKPPLVLD